MTTELRLIVPEGTTTAQPVLQYRNLQDIEHVRFGGPPRPEPVWRTVPVVTVPVAEFNKANSVVPPIGTQENFGGSD